MRRRLRQISSERLPVVRPRDTTFQLRLPNPYGGTPWLTATVALSQVPAGQGETTRLRAHLDGCLRLPGATARGGRLIHDQPRPGLVRYGRQAAAALARRVVDRLPAERLESIASRRWRSWLDIQISTAPLDRGAEALMPAPLREICGESLPRAAAGEPRIGVWSGPAGGAAGGVAALAMLQLDEEDLRGRRSARPASREGRGFSLNASVAQLIEPSGESREPS